MSEQNVTAPRMRPAVLRVLGSAETWVPLTILFARVFGAVLGLVLSLVMARVMGPHEMGRALTAMSLAMILPIFASGSCEIGASRFLTQALYRDENARAAGFVRMTWQVAAICVPIVIVVGVLLCLRISPENARTAFLIAVVSAALMGVLRIGSAHAMGFSRVIVATLPGTFLRPLMLLMFFGLYLLIWSETPSATVVLACFLLSAIVNLALQQLLLMRNYRALKGVTRDMSERRGWVTYGLQMGATMLFIEYSKEVTVLFSSFSLTPADVASLSVALSFVGFVRFGVVAVNQSITPNLSRSIAAGDDNRLLEIVDRAALMKLVPAVGGLLLFGLFGHQLLRLYNAGFEQSWWLLLLLMADPLCLAIFGPAANVLSLTGQQRRLMKVGLVMLVVLAALVVLGGYGFGLVGAAIGATVAWTGFYALLTLLVWREKRVNLTLLGTLKRKLR